MATQITNLTPAEKLFRQCLLDCRDTMSTIPGMKDLVLRWTGGWVRDKLLNVPSHDIDVALSTMTGEQFGHALKEFMQVHGTKYEEAAKKEGFKAELKNLHKIAANPEKSKHLETITTRMFGIDVDFVNLRKEVYDDHSRNPKVEFGTPEEDALRRDATVNALFFNVDTMEVEDFTGKGLNDMGKKIIRTPLQPYQTFKDDPLRVLRLIRFASRLGYEIEENAMEAMKDKTIHEALRAKISRERVGVEVDKMVKGPDPYRALMDIETCDLYSTVFANPNDAHCPQNRNSPAVYSALVTITEDHALTSVSSPLETKKDLGLSWTLAAYVPWYGEPPEKVVSASWEGIKATAILQKLLGDCIKHREAISGLVNKVVKNKASRMDIGFTLRSAGSSWRNQVLYALLVETVNRGFEAAISDYRTFLQKLSEEDLLGAAEIKPIVNGNEVKRAFGDPKAGSWLKSALDEVVRWQFANPSGTKEEALEMITARKGEFDLG